MLRNYKELKVWQKSYKLYLEIYRNILWFCLRALLHHLATETGKKSRLAGDSDLIEKGVLGKLALESLTPGIPGPSSQIKLEKNQFISERT
jgi:hypothetical protein